MLDIWRDTPYKGSNEHYYGLSGFHFIKNHLGYRYVIRDSRLTGRLPLGDELVLTARPGFAINNTNLSIRFANLDFWNEELRANFMGSFELIEAIVAEER